MHATDVGWEVTSDVAHRLLDGVEPEVLAPQLEVTRSSTWTLRSA